ncbi:MAG TPA: AAA family ATPase [Acidimicrobiales bacterium]|nr:AAA family ATPase [Acidimicrobiales bacterium]
MWTAFAFLLLLAAFLGIVNYAQPHVAGDRLRFDTYVSLAATGQIRSARLLNEDGYVVGTYVPRPTTAPAPSAATFSSMESLHGPPAAPRPAVAGPTRRYFAPIIGSLQVPLVQLLIEDGVPVTIDRQNGKRYAGAAGVVLPSLLIAVLLAYLILSYRSGTGLFGARSGARKIQAHKVGVTFADVAGQDAAVADLREIADFLARPERFTAIGADVPRGVLLYGPPGCGKTLLAKALAGEAGASFFSISGSDFVELYVGVGAARVRSLFTEARENAPSLVFIDEMDAIGRARGMVGTVQSHGEQEQALNQILTEMDGFSPGGGVIVIGATNRPDVLDKALLRPGRFDRTIGLERPDERSRLAILQVHAKGKQLDATVDLAATARRCVGLTGADLASVLNESAIMAARASRTAVSQVDVDGAVRHILQAPERQRRLSLREQSVGRRFAADERVTFGDVAGVDEAIEELVEVRDYLAEPERFAQLGARVPRGILLSGPPGSGKTLLARAVAGEANAAFIAASASEFVEVFAGQGASRVRNLFAEARSLAPAIVFIDEIDSMGATRGTGIDGSHEREQTLNQLLVEMDGFEAASAVIVMAATNRPDILDPALVRPGRFDRKVALTVPDRDGRLAILRLHAAGKRLAADVRLEAVAGLTRGFCGADLANVLNEAALLAARRNLDEVPMSLVEEGIDRAHLGIRSGALADEQERLVIAYHEAGHALVARALPGATPPHKVTILPRGGTLGFCAFLDTHDRVVVGRSELLDGMAAALGGWAAERLVFGQASNGSSGDLERAGATARHMVEDLGMGEETGPLAVSRRGISGHEARLVYEEVRRLIDEAVLRAGEALAGQRAALDAVAHALVERDTMSSDEIEQLVAHAAPAGPANRHHAMS